MGFVADIVGGILGSNASKDAAKIQAKASEKATAAQLEMYETTRGDLAKYRTIGELASKDMMSMFVGSGTNVDDYTWDDFLNSDDYKNTYQFGLDSGLKALTRAASASGGLLGGSTVKALTQYGSNYANTMFSDAWSRFNTDRSNRFNRVFQLMGLGESAAAQTGAAGTVAANQISANTIAAGNAQAAGQIGAANAWSNTIGNMANSFSDWYSMNNDDNPDNDRPVTSLLFG